MAVVGLAHDGALANAAGVIGSHVPTKANARRARETNPIVISRTPTETCGCNMDETRSEILVLFDQSMLHPRSPEMLG